MLKEDKDSNYLDFDFYSEWRWIYMHLFNFISKWSRHELRDIQWTYVNSSQV